MNWKFWRRKDASDFELVTKVVSMPTLARWYLYDTATKDPNMLASALGLAHVSEEGEETEKSASKARAEKVAPYVGFLQSMATINAITMVNAYRLGLPDADEDTLDHMKELLLMASYLASFSAFSAAFELNLIENPGMVATEEAQDE